MSNLTDFSKEILITLSTKNTNRQTYIHEILKHLQDVRVDYMLGRNINISNCKTIFTERIEGKHISDHYGLIGDIK